MIQAKAIWFRKGIYEKNLKARPIGKSWSKEGRGGFGKTSAVKATPE